MPKFLRSERNQREGLNKFFVSDRKRRLGFRPRPGDTDRLWKKLTDSLTNIPSEGWESFEQHPHFQATSQPFYRIQMVKRGRRFIQEVPISVTGGVFNLEYSPDGKILSAACEKKNILIFDPLTQRIVRYIEKAHSDSVNCVRFLDTRTFASCSDDTTVALWDVRNLKSRMRTLRGHSHWVKNIEYSSQNNLLVTSGFDGAIYTWELNKFTEGRSEGCHNKVFNMSGLMRMRLSPDSDKMIISTSEGFLMVIHDVDLNTMDKDLEGFKPDVYREMQETRGYHEMALNFTKLFHAKKNRVELIADFPAGDEAKTISSLRIHPQGWVAATRNLSSDSNSEWCCIHDIQTIPLKEEDDEMVSTEQNSSAAPQPLRSSSPLRGGVRFVNPFLAPGRESDSDSDSSGPPIAETWGTESGNIQIISTGLPTSRRASRPGIRVNFRLRNNQDDSSSSSDEDETDGTNENNTSNENNTNDDQEENRAENIEVEGTNFLAASTLAALGDIFEPPNLSDLQFERDLREREQIAREESERRESEENDDRIPTISLPPVYPGFGRSLAERNNRRSSIAELLNLRELPTSGFRITRTPGRFAYFGSPAARRAQLARIPVDAKIHHNTNRLTHFIEESNTGRGFIKEMAFSSCGRVLASPFGFGVRLLGWNSSCSDLMECVPASPVQLHEFGQSTTHTGSVVSTAFNPCSWQLVTGCLLGKICWHNPIL